MAGRSPHLYIGLIWRFVQRDWRNGELTLMLLALMVAVAAVSSVSFFSDRVQRAMNYQAAELLAADMLLVSRRPLSSKYSEQAETLGLKTASTTAMRSVVVTDNDEFLLAEIKAVSPHYPLYGRLKISAGPYQEPQEASDLPRVGEVWVESNLLTNLQVAVGDRLQVGDAFFRIAKVLRYEPDRGGNLYQIGPRVLMNADDLSQTGLLGPVSLVFYRLLVSGGPEALQSYQQWLDKHLDRGVEIQTVENARPEIRRALERARQFLGLAVIITVIVASVAIAVMARHFSQQQSTTSAVLKCLGASQRFVRYLYLSRLLLLALFVSTIGVGLGYLMQQLLSSVMAQWFVVELPAAGIIPWSVGLFVGIVVLLGFAVPSILQLSAVPPLKVIRRDLGAPSVPALVLLATALLSIALVIAWLAQDTKLAMITLAGVVVSVLLSMLVARLLLKLLQQLPRRGMMWRYGLSNILRHRQFSVLQLTAFSLSLMALLLLTIVRVDILKQWQLSLPANTPNHFLINIQPHEQEALQQAFVERGWEAPTMGPIVVARLVAINGKKITSADYPEGSRAQWTIERDQRLSFTAVLPESNTLLDGVFWGSDAGAAQPQWSFEKSYAEGLGLTLGDEVTFNIGGEQATARITSLREVAWDSMDINFFVLGAPDFLRQYPATYITSFYLPPDEGTFIVHLAREFPGVTIVDVRALIEQIRKIADRAAMAVEYIFLFTLVACLLVLYASIYASRDARARETSLLRALGSTRLQVMGGFAVEFALLGLLAGLSAAAISAVAAGLIAGQVFNIEYTVNWVLLCTAVVGSILLVGFAGILGVRSLLSTPPMRALTQFDLN